MIRAVAEQEQNPYAAPEQPGKPLIMIPVTAQDVARRKRKILLALLAGVAIVGGIAWLAYKRVNDPVQVRQAYDSGVRLMRATRYDQAILNFDRAIEIRPDTVDAYRMRARTYILQSNPDAAIPDFTRVMEFLPNDASVLIERGSAYLGKNDFPRALADAERAISLDSKSPQTYALRAAAERATGDSAGAIQDYTKALDLTPSLEYYFQRGSTYQLLGEHRLALADLDKAVEYSPDQPHLYFARAQSRAALGDAAGAKSDIQTGRKIDGW